VVELNLCPDGSRQTARLVCADQRPAAKWPSRSADHPFMTELPKRPYVLSLALCRKGGNKHKDRLFLPHIGNSQPFARPRECLGAMVKSQFLRKNKHLPRVTTLSPLFGPFLKCHVNVSDSRRSLGSEFIPPVSFRPFRVAQTLHPTDQPIGLPVHCDSETWPGHNFLSCLPGHLSSPHGSRSSASGN
jgi:hypothetical protein